MANIKVNLENTGIKKDKLMKYSEKVENAHKELQRMSSDKTEFVRVVTFTN